MSNSTADSAAGTEAPATWHVRDARAEDAPRVAAAVADLLRELGAEPPDRQAMESVAHSLIDEPRSGLVLVADADERLIGALTASWQTAIHVPGRYLLIQDLWVAPAWRSREVGSQLVAELCRRVREQDVRRIEVGLPKNGFPAIEATVAFYRRNGFAALGPRMRLLLD